MTIRSSGLRSFWWERLANADFAYYEDDATLQPGFVRKGDSPFLPLLKKGLRRVHLLHEGDIQRLPPFCSRGEEERPRLTEGGVWE